MSSDTCGIHWEMGMMAVTYNYAFDPAGLTDPATYYDDYTASSIKAAYMTVEESVV